MSLHPIVQTFSDYLDNNPDVKQAFMESFDVARSTAIKEFEDIHDLKDYIKYMNEHVNWVPTENIQGKDIYQKLCMFYYVLDLPPMCNYQDPIEPSTNPPYRWMSEWLVKYAKEMGLWMDTPESITPESLQTFYNSPSYHMQDYRVPPSGWKTFNEFFARHIDLDLRPIVSPTDDTVVVSPADCTFYGWFPINEEAAVTTFSVKGIPWMIAQLLADDTSDTSYGPLFAGGVFTHSFLNTTDYHRQHAPVADRVVSAKIIPGLVHLEVALVPDGSGSMRLGMHRHISEQSDSDKQLSLAPDHPPHIDSPAGHFYAPDSPGYQFLQARALILIDNPVLGLVVVLPIGMAQVSSVVLSAKEGDVVTKGQEISYFQFGGSDIVMVFQRDAHIQFEQKVGEHYNVGQRVAVGSGNQ